jgi:dihydrofolate synthase/folylpolyglutamate synthase
VSSLIEAWQAWLYERLSAYELSGRKALHPTLQYMQAWDARLGHPHRAYPIIHIAGTNGKGSTAAFLASILQWAGYRVGYHTSPHFFRFTERMRVNGQEPPEAWVDAFLKSHAQFIVEQNLSFFEVTVGMSLAWFQQAQVDIAVVEVGLGGRWDATNVIEAPLVSVLTPIDWDHVEVLGPTLTHIAGEKAGIIKPGRPVVVSPAQPPEALRVFQETTQARNAPLIISEKPLVPLDWVLEEALPYRRFWEPHTEKIYLSDLPGDYQGVNLRTALQVVQVLRTQGWTIPETAVEKGLQYAAQTAPLWGRTQWILHEKSPILLEVAHNPQGFAALRKLLEKAPYQIEIALIGFSADKDYRGALSQLQGLPIEIWAVAAQNPRALAPAEITRTAQQLGFSAQEGESTISQTLFKALSCGKPILVAGSIFVVAEALAALRTNPQQQNPMNTLAPRPR